MNRLSVSRASGVALVTSATFIDIVAYSAGVPVLPDLAMRLGGGPTIVGLLFAVFGGSLLLISIPMGRVSDHIGRKRPMILGLLTLAVASLMLAFARTLRMLFLARLLQGAADGITWVVGLALIADLYGPDERGHVMGLVMAGTSFGLMIGPTLGGWLYELGGVTLPFVVVSAAAVANALAFLIVRTPPPAAEPLRVPLTRVLQEPAIVVCAIAVVCGAGTIAMLEPVLALFFGTRLGLGPARIGLLFGIAAAGSAALHPIYGRLSDRYGGRTLTLIGLMLSACLLPVMQIASSFGTAAACILILWAALGLMITPSLAFISEAASAAQLGSYGVVYGIYNVAWGIGLLVGPAVGGFAFERLGFGPLAFAWAPLLLLVAVALARAR